MQNATTNQLSCSVFGHNIERNSLVQNDAHKYTCKTCKCEIQADDAGEFQLLPFENSEINNCLQRLFLLNHMISRQRISA